MASRYGGSSALVSIYLSGLRRPNNSNEQARPINGIKLQRNIIRKNGAKDYKVVHWRNSIRQQ